MLSALPQEKDPGSSKEKKEKKEKAADSKGDSKDKKEKKVRVAAAATVVPLPHLRVLFGNVGVGQPTVCSVLTCMGQSSTCTYPHTHARARAWHNSCTDMHAVPARTCAGAQGQGAQEGAQRAQERCQAQQQ